MLFQPRLDAVAVEPMIARQNGHLCPQVHIVHTYRTFGFALATQHLLIHLLLLERVDGLFRRRGRGSTAIVLIHQLRHDPVKGFLAENHVAVLRVSWVEELGE